MRELTRNEKIIQFRWPRTAKQSVFPIVNGPYHLEQSLPFPTIVYCRLHEEDKVLIAEI